MVKTPARRTAPHIAVVDGQPTTTSRDIAETFGKDHKAVVERIKNLDCSEAFRSAEFSAHPYVNPQNGQTYTEYRVTRDGFAFLCMGFTGAKAAQWKERYIATFNKLAEKLADHSPGVRKMVALPAPTRRMTPEMETAIDIRTGQIIGTAYTEVRQWLLDQVLRGCTTLDGTAAPNFDATLAGADFTAFSTAYANKHLESIVKVLHFIQHESGDLITRVQAERQRIANPKGQP